MEKLSKASRKAIQYGEKREWARLKQIQDLNGKLEDEISRILKRTHDDVLKDVEIFSRRYAKSNRISLTEALEQASTADVKTLAQRAKDYVKARWSGDLKTPFTAEATREMRTYNFSLRMSRYELLLQNMDLALSEGYDRLRDHTFQHLLLMTGEELQRQAGILGDSVLNPQEMRETAQLIAQSSHHQTDFSKLLWRDQDELRKRLTVGLQQSLITGMHPDQWRKSLYQLYDSEFRKKDYSARRIAITEAGRAQIEAQRFSYDKYGYDYFMVICEPTACESVCAPHHGEVYKVQEMQQGLNAPMFHPFCMCSTAPYVPRIEVERELAQFERLREDLTDQERFDRILDSVKRNRAFLGRDERLDGLVARLDNPGPRELNKFANPDVPLTILEGKQRKHILGTHEYLQAAEDLNRDRRYGPSYLTITIEEAQRLVNTFHGTGTLQKDGKTEVIITNNDILGVVVNDLTGASVYTTVFKIHYGKNGTHIVPDYPSKKKRRGL